MRRVILGLVLLAVAVAAAVGVARWAGPLFASGGGPSWYTRTVYPLKYAGAIRAGAARYRLDPALVAAVVYAESKFDEHARSSQGAVGLMQVLPKTADQIAGESGGVTFTTADLEDPRINVRYGSYYLRQALDAFDGDKAAAVASYNAGMGVVGEWVGQAHAAGHDLRLEDIPYPETRAYVQKVLEARRVYREQYGDRLGTSAAAP
ncbi:MAG TPA: lytic transglycosylase domain-containing protein [Thermoleophilia bacterium]|nr:lytic transglycosylase domain-containing protein [Thermoleophilia bacterium]